MRLSTWALGFFSAYGTFYGVHWAFLTVLVPFAVEMRGILGSEA